jgi:DNA primase
MIPESVVEEVRARADIVEIIGEHVQLKRAGKEFRALCPFHNEKTPSFYVVPGKNFYKCFGCGESGDAFTFLMKKVGLSFQDAIRSVASKVGVEVPAVEVTRPADEPNRALYEAIAFAADFYQQQLWNTAAGERGRKYLESRGLTRAHAERFGIGYAPDAWRALREAAHKHGLDDQVLLAAGLIKTNENADEPYDRLRDRLIFPVADLGGRYIGFGGRILGKAGEGTPKYLNSPETPIHQKGRILYGLNWSKNAIRREGAALLVEGYMDYVSLACRGIENVVAGLGTALTAEHAILLSRYTKKALLLYDSDTAGLKATFRTGDALLRAGVEPLVVTLPPGEDPDSLVRKGGPQALAGYIGQAVDVLDRKMQILEEREFFTDIEGVRRALDRLLPTIRSAADPALRDIYVARVAERTGVRRETIERELTAEPAQGGRVENRPRRPFRGNRFGADIPAPESLRAQARSEEWAAEKLLLQLLLRDPDRIEHARGLVQPDEIRDPLHRSVYELLLAHGPLPAELPPELGLPAPVRDAVTRLRAEGAQIVEGDLSFDHAVARIRIGGLHRRLDDLDRRVSLADAAHAEALIQEKLGVLAEVRELEKRLRLGFAISPRYGRSIKHRRDERPRP